MSSTHVLHTGDLQMRLGLNVESALAYWLVECSSIDLW